MFRWGDLLPEMRLEVVNSILDLGRTDPSWRLALFLLGHTSKDNFDLCIKRVLKCQGKCEFSLGELGATLAAKDWRVTEYLLAGRR